MTKRPIYRIESFECIGKYSLRLSFSDGAVRVIDFDPIITGELFGPLQDPSLLLS